MVKKYLINTSDGITTICFSEQPDVDEICNVIDEVAEGNPGRLRLWDLSRTGLDLTTPQLHQLAQYGKSKSLPPSKVAIVAREDFTFGIMRMYEVFREDQIVKHKIFRTVQEARGWLNEQANQ